MSKKRKNIHEIADERGIQQVPWFENSRYFDDLAISRL